MADRSIAATHWKLALAWTVVYAANLALPMQAGLEATRGGARMGMGLAVLSYWIIGTALIGRLPRAAMGFTLGGVFVGFSQIFPVLHLFAGRIAFAAWDALLFGAGDSRRTHLDSFAAGFSATAMAGGMLLVLAGLLGGHMLQLNDWFAAQAAADDRPPDRNAGQPRRPQGISESSQYANNGKPQT